MAVYLESPGELLKPQCEDCSLDDDISLSEGDTGTPGDVSVQPRLRSYNLTYKPLSLTVK